MCPMSYQGYHVRLFVLRVDDIAYSIVTTLGGRVIFNTNLRSNKLLESFKCNMVGCSIAELRCRIGLCLPSHGHLQEITEGRACTIVSDPDIHDFTRVFIQALSSAISYYPITHHHLISKKLAAEYAGKIKELITKVTYTDIRYHASD